MSQLVWEFEATIELKITMTVKVRAKSQEEAAHHCDVLRIKARKHYPDAYIGCGVIEVKQAV